MSFFGKWSFRRSRRKEPRRDPVLPAMLWRSMSPKGRDVRLYFSKESAGNLSRGNRSRRPRGPPSRADLLALTVPVRLVVSGASAVLAHVDVLGVVEIRKRRDQDCVDDLERTGSGAGKEAPKSQMFFVSLPTFPRLQVKKNGP